MLNYKLDFILGYVLNKESKIHRQPWTNGSVPSMPQTYSVQVKNTIKVVANLKSMAKNGY